MQSHTTGQRYTRYLLVVFLALFSSLAATVSGVGGGVALAATPISLTMTAAPSPVASGAQLTYTITVTNGGGAAVSAAALSDQIGGMTGLILTSSAGTCGQTTNLVTCNAGTLSGGTVWTVTIRGTVTAASGTTLNNTATATATKSSQTFTATATTNTLVQGGGGGALPDLTLSISAPSSVVTSSAYAYSLTVNNVGTANATNIPFQDTLPAGVVWVSTNTSSLFSCTTSGQIVSCTGGAVNAGANATITINVTAPSTTGSVTDTAIVNPNCTIVESNCQNNAASATTNVTTSSPPGTLTISKTASPSPSVAGGAQLTYTVIVNNTSTSRADGLQITDGTQGLDAASVSATTTSGSCVVSASIVTCVAPKPGQFLAAGASITVTVKGTVVASPGSTIVNTATVTGNISHVGVTNTATVSTSVRPSIDLTVTQALTSPVGPTPTRARGAFTYVITVGNSGLNDASNVEVREPLPADVLTNPQSPPNTFFTATGGFVCTATAAANPTNVLILDCTGGLVHGSASGGTTDTITVNLVAPNAIGNITSTVTVNPYNAIPESDTTNNTAVSTTFVDTGVDLTNTQVTNCFQATHPPTACPNLALPGAGGGTAPTVAPSGIYSYVITVPNNGTQDASNILVRDILPASVTFRVATGDHNFTCSQANGVVDCAGGIIKGTSTPANPIDKATITIQVSAPTQPGTLTNQVIVDPNNTIPEIDKTNNTSTQLQQVKLGGGGGFIDLLIPTLINAPNPVVPSGVLDYSLTVENQGTDTAFNVTVQDTLPANTVFRSAADTATGAGSFTCTQAGGVVTCTGGTLPGTDYTSPVGTVVTRTITIEVFAPTQPATITDQATIDPTNQIAESDETNNQALTTTVVKLGGGGTFIDLTAALSANFGTGSTQFPGPNAVPGGAITYVLTLANIGTADAFNVEATDTLPAGTTFVSAVDNGTAGFVCGQANGVVDCTGGYLPAGASETINIVATAPNTASAFSQTVTPNPITLIDQARVDLNNAIPEGNETNNSAVWQTTVLSKIDLSVTQTGPDTATQSSNATYVLTVKNNGTADASGVLVHDALPVGLIETSVDQSPANAFGCQITQNPVNVVDCTGDLAAGATVTINIQVFVTATDGTTFSNQACVDPNNTIVEYDETNNCSNVSTTVGHSDLTINKTAGTPTVSPGDVETYTLLVSNIGTAADAANSATVTDDLSSIGLTVVGTPTTTNGFTCTVASNVVTCTNSAAALAAGSSATITIKAMVPTTATGQITNTATVADSDTSDTDTSNKSSTATISVGALTIDLAVLSVTGTPGAVGPGQTVTYSVQAANLGTGAATSSPVLIRNVLTNASGLTLVSAVGTNGFTCGALSGNNVDCTGAGLGAAGTSGSPASTTTLTLRFLADTGAVNPIRLTSTIDPLSVYSTDTNTANNTASANTSFSASAACSPAPCKDLATTILGSPNPVASGGTMNYAVTVGNVGTEDLHGAVGSPAVVEYINLDSTATGVSGVTVTGGTGLPNPWACDPYPVTPTPPAFPGTATTLVCHGDLTAGQGAVITFSATFSAASGASINSVVIVDPSQSIETPDGLDTDTSSIAVS